MAVKQALDTLREIRDGAFLDELSGEINELIRQVLQDGQKRLADDLARSKGSLTISLEVKPVEGDATRVIVDDQVKVTPPKVKKSTLFYTTPESNLSLRNPNQPDLPGLSDVSYSDEDIKDHTTNDQEAA